MFGDRRNRVELTPACAFRYDEMRRPARGTAEHTQGQLSNFHTAMYTCRECETEINQATELCPHCGADLTAPIAGAEGSLPKPALRKILIRWGVLLGVLLGAIWSFLWFVVPARQCNPTTQAEARAAESLRE